MNRGINASRHRHNPLNDFVTTWETTDTTAIIPLTLGQTYNFNYSVNGGSFINHTSDTLTVTGLTNGIPQEIRFSPNNGGFPEFTFNNLGDKDKIIDVSQWGTNVWASVSSMFYGCSNALFTATDNPDLSLVSSVNNMFRACTTADPDVSNWNVSTIDNMGGMFRDAINAEPDVSNWNTSLATNFNNVFVNLIFTRLVIKDWDVTSLTSGASFLSGTSIDTDLYDQTLINWSAQSVNTGVTILFGSSKYTLGGAAEAARNTLTNAPNNWLITDGGGI